MKISIRLLVPVRRIIHCPIDTPCVNNRPATFLLNTNHLCHIYERIHDGDPTVQPAYQRLLQVADVYATILG